MLIDVSHAIESGMVTYKGLPAPLVCDFLSREASRKVYAAGTEFHIGKVERAATTGTSLDAPFHRFADGLDVSQLPLDRVATLPGLVVRVEPGRRAVTRELFAKLDVRGKAVLVHTGWDTHWRTDRYFEGHPYLTADAAVYLRDRGAILVGIDSFNIDNVDGNTRPVHSTLLAAGI